MLLIWGSTLAWTARSVRRNFRQLSIVVQHKLRVNARSFYLLFKLLEQLWLVDLTWQLHIPVIHETLPLFHALSLPYFFLGSNSRLVHRLLLELVVIEDAVLIYVVLFCPMSSSWIFRLLLVVLGSFSILGLFLLEFFLFFLSRLEHICAPLLCHHLSLLIIHSL